MFYSFPITFCYDAYVYHFEMISYSIYPHKFDLFKPAPYEINYDCFVFRSNLLWYKFFGYKFCMFYPFENSHNDLIHESVAKFGNLLKFCSRISSVFPVLICDTWKVNMIKFDVNVYDSILFTKIKNLGSMLARLPHCLEIFYEYPSNWIEV